MENHTADRADTPRAKLIRKALEFISSIATEELGHSKPGSGAECALRHITRKTKEIFELIQSPPGEEPGNPDSSGPSPSFIPGPWVWSFESVDPEWAVVHLPGGIVIANVNAHHRQEANARLIAASPDLYAACKAILPYLSTQSDLLNYASLNDGRASGYDVASVKIREALAKAEGK